MVAGGSGGGGGGDGEATGRTFGLNPIVLAVAALVIHCLVYLMTMAGLMVTRLTWLQLLL